MINTIKKNMPSFTTTLKNIYQNISRFINPYKEKIKYTLLSASIIGTAVLNASNISGIIHNDISLKRVGNNSQVTSSVYLQKNTNTKNNISKADEIKLKKILDKQIITFLSNKYNINSNNVLFYINKSMRYINNTVDTVWDDIVQKSINDADYNYIKNNLIHAYGNPDVVKSAIKRIIMVENSGIKNTKRDVAEFFLQWGMQENLQLFKLTERSAKGAMGICQITKKAIDEVNNRFGFAYSFDEVAQDHRLSIKYAMALQALHYDILRYDTDIKNTNIKVSNKKYNKVNKNKKQKKEVSIKNVEFITTESVFYKILSKLPHDEYVLTKEYLLAMFYNKGPSIKNIVNKKYKNTNITKINPSKAKNLLLATINKNAPQETKGYFNKIIKLQNTFNI